MKKVKEKSELLKGLVWILGTLGLILVAWLAGDFSPEANQPGAGGSVIVQVIEVIDGDTIRVKNEESGEVFRVRYLGIDTPEIDGSGYESCFADLATERNEELVGGEIVTLKFDIDRYDRFGRTLAYVYTEDDIFVNLDLIEEGYARFYLDKQNTNHQDEFISGALEAQSDFRGIWGVCGESIYNGECVIKGNVDKMGQKYYHLPGDRYYSKTVINLDKEDQWLCSVEEAEAKNFEHALE